MAIWNTLGLLGDQDTDRDGLGFTRKRVYEVAGTFIFLLCVAALISLLSWSHDDPSFNHATGAAPGNLLGLPGAQTADLMMQMFGLAAPMLIFVAALWGWRLTAHRPLSHMVWRLPALLLGVTGLSGLVAVLPAPGVWPLQTGLGGASGELALANLSALFAALLPNIGGQPFALLLLLPLTAVLLLYAADLRLSELLSVMRLFGEEGRDAALRSYGAADHMRLSMAAAWRRWRRRLSALKARLPFVRAAEPAAAEEAFEDYDYDETGAEDYDEADWDEAEPAPSWLARLRQRVLGAESPAVPDPNHGRIEPVFFDNYRPNLANEPDPAASQQDLLSAAQRVERSAKRIRPGKRARKEAEPEFPFCPPESYQLPSLSFLVAPKKPARKASGNDRALEQNARLLEAVLDDFGIRGKILKVRPGPVVTLYELEPAPGIKSSRVIGLADDIARSMSAISARIAVVPGRNVIGIELPNAARETVYLQELVASSDYDNSKASLPLILGKTIGGEPVIADLARMPHLLIAGTTGAGKSVGVNTMILSLLYRLPPDKCKLIMVDPKMLELSVYDGIPHLLTPVVTDPNKAVVALKWTVREMETRYQSMSKLGVRNIDGYNARVETAAKRGEVLTRKVQTGFEPETGQAIYEEEELNLEPMPYIVVVVDEMADLMMVAGKDIEGAIQRLAQMARAAGIHMITATQRPSVDVITGTIKANFPTRISFQVTSKIDSRTILGEQGAEQLLGRGDMLYMAGGGRITRVHGAFVTDEEVEDIVAHLKTQGVPEYLEAVTEETEEEAGAAFGLSGGTSKEDQLFDQAIAIVAADRKVSTSYIQRRLSIGYNRAATIIERMEEEGVIGPANHAGKREILLPDPEDAF